VISLLIACLIGGIAAMSASLLDDVWPRLDRIVCERLASLPECTAFDLGTIWPSLCADMVLDAMLGPRQSFSAGGYELLRDAVVAYFFSTPGGPRPGAGALIRQEVAKQSLRILDTLGGMEATATAVPSASCMAAPMLRVLAGSEVQPANCADAQLTHLELLSNVLAGIGAGTVGLFFYTMDIAYQLSTRRQLQDRAHVAVGTFLGEGTRTSSSLLNAPLVSDIVRESLRLSPLQADLTRDCLRDVVLRNSSGDGVLRCPANTTLCFDLATMQRDVDVFGDDADEFEPGRWTKATLAQRTALFTFGSGCAIRSLWIVSLSIA
jgi:cytochrome P450